MKRKNPQQFYTAKKKNKDEAERKKKFEPNRRFPPQIEKKMKTMGVWRPFFWRFLPAGAHHLTREVVNAAAPIFPFTASAAIFNSDAVLVVIQRDIAHVPAAPAEQIAGSVVVVFTGAETLLPLFGMARTATTGSSTSHLICVFFCFFGGG
jgi:hypothetical protein